MVTLRRNGRVLQFKQIEEESWRSTQPKGELPTTSGNVEDYLINTSQLKRMYHRGEIEAAEMLYTTQEKQEGTEGKMEEEVIQEFKDVFPDDLPNALPPRRDVDHKIELETGHSPPHRAPY